ncbi:hypothetical protein [Winogradskyella flava]|uniref:Uncharacterized protein n=1 Tax=Winogradskyella flava TaxID=1884876 RepID=A0A842IVB5_9FLAO|nr:hypothetical protein [Winogradskyella flava]MBC2846755.1 hypothetical protein [Winogradskyella flava]
MKLSKFALILLLIITQSCVQETHTKTVTFKVDMNAVENVSNVGIRGNFTDNPWTETVPLTDTNSDGIYEGTFSQKTAHNQIQFKFVNQGGDYELKDTDNRIIEFEYKPETITYEAVFNNPEAKITKN